MDDKTLQKDLRILEWQDSRAKGQSNPNTTKMGSIIVTPCYYYKMSYNA